MIVKVYTIEEKKPPVHRVIIVGGYFEANNNLCRYTICRFNGIDFIADNSIVRNVYYWAELENLPTISCTEYTEIEKSFTINTIRFLLLKLDEWGEHTDKVLLLKNEYGDIETITKEFYDYIYSH